MGATSVATIGDYQPPRAEPRGYGHRSEQLRLLQNAVLGREPASSPIVMPQPYRGQIVRPAVSAAPGPLRQESGAPINPKNSRDANAARVIAAQAIAAAQSPNAAEQFSMPVNTLSLGATVNGPVGPVFAPAPTGR